MLNLDTHILIDAVRDELSRKERRYLSAHSWSISAIVLWELEMLTQRKRIQPGIDDLDFQQVLREIHVWPITLEICLRLRSLDFKSDPSDELIAATSLVHRVPLLTRDKKILSSKIIPLVK